MSDINIALITIFGTVASVTGVVAYVFNRTRNLIKEIRDLARETRDLTREIHSATLEMQKTAEQRHMEVIELLKKGFGELSKDISELKITIRK